MITSKKMGKNYLYYSEDDNKNVRTCEQVVNSWDKAVNYVIEDASKNQNGLREAQPVSYTHLDVYKRQG